MNHPTRILVVEDHAASAAAVRAVLTREGHAVEVATTVAEGLAAFARDPHALVLTDLRLPDGDGLAVLEGVRSQDPFVEVVVMTAYGTVEVALRAVRGGAFDFLEKPLRPEALEVAARNALGRRELRLRVDRLAQVAGREAGPFEAPVAASPAMRTILDQALHVARTPATVLLRGESGTGKEVVARAIHRASERDGPMVPVNCAVFAPGLLESELFGHERGAFTGAEGRRIGRLELAEGGTLFLDEIGEIDPAIQVKLLRVLQERVFERVGGVQAIPMRCRIVAATNRDLEVAMREGRFREDLFYRLNVVPLVLPPLRERREDIEPLFRRAVRRAARACGRPEPPIEPPLVARLVAYGWPGNVRELENLAERMVVLSRDGTLDDGALPQGPRTVAPIADDVAAAPIGETYDLQAYLDAVERRLLERAVEQAGGVKARAAAQLGLERNALRYRMKRLGMLDP